MNSGWGRGETTPHLGLGLVARMRVTVGGRVRRRGFGLFKDWVSCERSLPGGGVALWVRGRAWFCYVFGTVIIPPPNSNNRVPLFPWKPLLWPGQAPPITTPPPLPIRTWWPLVLSYELLNPTTIPLFPTIPHCETGMSHTHAHREHGMDSMFY